MRSGAVTPAAEQELVLGRYRLQERLGAGGFGVVWRAHDELLRREVAVKRIALPTSADRDRATREALAGARLAHPAIVALYEAGSDSQAFYLISELVHGETLAQALAAEELCDEELMEIGVALCDALAHAHARGVVHRDVKPQNVLLPDSPEPGEQPLAIAKLTDFGGAQLVGEEALTRTGDVLGTFAYMAPEQSEGRGVGPATDLYSLALVLYEGFSGSNPVRGPTPAATVRRIGRPLPPLARLRGDLPRELTRALDAAVCPEPADRGSLTDLREDLQDALAGPPRRHRWRRALEPPLVDPVPLEYRAGRDPRPPELWEPLGVGAVEARHEPQTPRPDAAGWLTGQRLLWVAAVLGLCAWQASAGRSGVAVVALAAVLPLVALVRRPGLRWLLAGFAPLLGVVGLAGAYPALAGQVVRWRSRAVLGALGYWWLTLAGLLLDDRAQHLWLGLPAGVSVRWESSPTLAVTHALVPVATLGVLLGALLWALAATLLPWLVRGRGAGPDALAAIGWAAGLAAASPVLDGGLRLHAGVPSPRGVIVGAALGAALAVGGQALRGRTGSRDH